MGASATVAHKTVIGYIIKGQHTGGFKVPKNQTLVNHFLCGEKQTSHFDGLLECNTFSNALRDDFFIFNFLETL